MKLNYLDDIPRGELSPVGVASLSRSLQENSSASPHHGVLLGEGFETLSFPLATRCFGKHKKLLLRAELRRQLHKIRKGCVPPDSMGGPENEKYS
ncbi:MAG: hypothetical protein DMG88_06825 [Acidobacteria bacterium]|nr:MAG: hypothetical protein DMG88_06825 [Acidobacteriota bacterium]